MSTHRIPIYITPNPTYAQIALGEDTLPSQGEPVMVNIDVPSSLIEMAEKYPTIDWNEVMRHAVAALPAKT